MPSNTANTRRTVLQAGGALLGGGVLGSLAGCSALNDALNDDAGSAGGVPDDATGVLHLDAAALRSDEALRDGVDDRLSQFPESFVAADVDSVDDVLGQLEDEYDLDPDGLSAATAFAEVESSSGYGGMLLDAEWSADDVADALEQGDAEYEEDDYEGQTVYESEDGDQLLGVLGSNQYVLGSEDAVEDAIDVALGNADSLSGDLGDRYGETAGMLRVAAEFQSEWIPEGSSGMSVNTAALEDTEFVSGSLSQSGDERSLSLVFHAEDDGAAADIEGVVENGLTLAERQLGRLAGQTQQSEFSSLLTDVRDLLGDVSVSQEGATVTADYTGSPSDIATVALVVGLLLNTAGFAQSKTEETGEQSSQQVANRLQSVSTVGTVDDGAVDQVTAVVKNAPGAGDIDLSNTTVQWVGPSGTYELVAPTATGPDSDGRFGIEAIKDEDGSAPVLNSPDDRFRLVFSLGSDADSGTAATAFGQPLAEETSATLELTTESGASTMLRVTVPASLAGQDAVAL